MLYILTNHLNNANEDTIPVESHALKQHNGGTSISSGVVLNDLDYADDIDLIDNDAATLQVQQGQGVLIDKVSMKAAEFGLNLKHSKCKVTSVLPTDFVFKVNEEPIETVKELPGQHSYS